jgi:hypothetical protein
MYNLVCTIALVIMLLLLLPASNTSSNTSPDGDVYAAPEKFDSSEINRVNDSTQIKSELCPALLELPIMFGRPAPCLRSYRLDK